MKNLKISALAAALLLGGCTHGVKEAPVSLPLPAPITPALRRSYTEGEVLKYKLELTYSMTGESETVAVSSAAATVKKRADGVFYEAWQWTGSREAGAERKLSRESRDFRQLLSLELPAELPHFVRAG